MTGGGPPKKQQNLSASQCRQIIDRTYNVVEGVIQPASAAEMQLSRDLDVTMYALFRERDGYAKRLDEGRYTSVTHYMLQQGFQARGMVGGAFHYSLMRAVVRFDNHHHARVDIQHCDFTGKVMLRHHLIEHYDTPEALRDGLQRFLNDAAAENPQQAGRVEREAREYAPKAVASQNAPQAEVKRLQARRDELVTRLHDLHFTRVPGGMETESADRPQARQEGLER
jgi:hypothetical protein